MRVRALRSFAGPLGRHAEGEVFDLPDGADWLACGLVEPAEDPDASFTPKPTSSAVKGYRAQERESGGWFDVAGPDGEIVNEKALREDDAHALAGEMNG